MKIAHDEQIVGLLDSTFDRRARQIFKLRQGSHAPSILRSRTSNIRSTSWFQYPLSDIEDALLVVSTHRSTRRDMKMVTARAHSGTWACCLCVIVLAVAF